jgi:hypothetical protein
MWSSSRTPDLAMRARAETAEARVQLLERALRRIVELKDEAYQHEPVSREVADVVARNAGRIARAALDGPVA